MGDTILMDRQTIGATLERELTADSADVSTLVDTALTEDDGFWNGSVLRTIRGMGVGQKRKVNDFDSALDTITVDAAWDAVPAAGTAYLLDRPAAVSELFRAGSFAHEISVEQLERAVKDASLSPFPSIPGKRSAQISFSTELRGSGAPGVAPDYGILFRACAMQETIVAGTSIAYAPESDKLDYSKICLTTFIDGLQVMYLGCMGSFSINCPLDGVPTVDWEFEAADFEVSDAPLSSGASYDEETPESILMSGFSFGGFHFDVANIRFAMNNEVVLRQSANASGGHVNALVTGRAPSGSFDPEAVLKATDDVFADWESGAQLPLKVQIGHKAGNICTITAPKCQYTDMGFSDREGLLTYDTPFRLARDEGDDEISIVFT
ncbi:MAG: phage tail tube protein [Nitrospinae bacterium]|nr:phage tail tube protein [Nitrospinota bacterium]